MSGWDILDKLCLIDPLAWLIIIGFSMLAIINIKLVQNYADLQARHHRFIATMISKKMFAWFVITMLFLFDRYIAEKIDFSVLLYLGFTCTVFGIDTVQKKIGLGQKGKL